MSIVLMGSTSGSITLSEPAVAGSNTISLPAVTGTVVVQGQNSPLTAGTAQTTTSGTSVTFSSIPSWVKKITVVYQGFSTTSTTQPQFRLGTSAGLVATAGQYTGQATYNNTTAMAAGSLASATGFDVTNAASSWTAANIYSGTAVFTNVVGSNIWVGWGSIASAGTGGTFTGQITLPDTLTQLALVVGGGAFDAVSINILYE